jgi:hypothetical protein
MFLANFFGSCGKTSQGSKCYKVPRVEGQKSFIIADEFQNWELLNDVGLHRHCLSNVDYVNLLKHIRHIILVLMKELYVLYG